MNRSMSICFIVLAVIVIILLTLHIRKEEKMLAEPPATEYEETEKVIQVNNESEYYEYIIKCIDKRLEVFREDGTVFMESGISYDELPDRIKSQIDEGLKIKDDEQLYDFLENYSS